MKRLLIFLLLALSVSAFGQMDKKKMMFMLMSSSVSDVSNLNLLTKSEGNVTTYPSKGNVTDALTSIVGFDNSVYFDTNTVLRYAYKLNYTPTIGVTYNLSCFIQMDDGGVPVIGTNVTTGDFCFVMNGVFGINDLVVTLISGSIYRISASKVAPSTSPNYGIVKYTGQSARKFKISGIQLTQGVDLKPYQKTT